MNPVRYDRGFTLLELSIVLVIIGLIVGGVLVGRDLILASQIRATVGQLEKFESARNTFRNKYNAVPGDMYPEQAAAFGFFTFSSSVPGVLGFANGDTYIQNAEIMAYWRHLSEANLIEGKYNMSAEADIDPLTGLNVGQVSDVSTAMPTIKLGNNVFAYAQYNNLSLWQRPPGNDYNISRVSYYDVGLWTIQNATMSPQTAYNIDLKLDDGRPTRGNVLGMGTAAASSTDGRCTIGSSSSDAAGVYNLTPTSGGTTPACSLIIGFK